MYLLEQLYVYKSLLKLKQNTYNKYSIVFKLS